mgnify:CR=1 FL=1
MLCNFCGQLIFPDDGYAIERLLTGEFPEGREERLSYHAECWGKDNDRRKPE